MCFHYRKLDPGIIHCSVQGPVKPEDYREFRAFLKENDARMLIDLEEAPLSDAAKFLCTMRSMLRKTALVGQRPPEYVLNPLPGKDFYKYDLAFFSDEQEALNWLRQDSQ